MSALRYRIAVQRIEENTTDDAETTRKEGTGGFVVVHSIGEHNHPTTSPRSPPPPAQIETITQDQIPEITGIPSSSSDSDSTSPAIAQVTMKRRRGRNSAPELFPGVPTISKKRRKELIRPPLTMGMIEEYRVWDEMIGGGRMDIGGVEGNGEGVLGLAMSRVLQVSSSKTVKLVEEPVPLPPLPLDPPTIILKPPPQHPPQKKERTIHSLPTRSSVRLVASTSRQNDVVSSTISRTPARKISPLFDRREMIDTPMTELEDSPVFPCIYTVEGEMEVEREGGDTTITATKGLGIDSLHFPFSHSTALSASTTTTSKSTSNIAKKGFLEFCLDRKRRPSTTVLIDTKNRRCSSVDHAGMEQEQGGSLSRDKTQESWFVDRSVGGGPSTIGGD